VKPILCTVIILLAAGLAQAPAGKEAAGTPGIAAKPQAPAGKEAAGTPGIAAKPPAETPPDAAVVTLEGVCAAKDSAGACRTVVTRAQFEHMMAALPGAATRKRPMSGFEKGRLANQYAQWLAFSLGAEKEGLDKLPEGVELLRVARMQALSRLMSDTLIERAKPTDEEIQKEYDSHLENYAVLELERIRVPIQREAGKSNEAEMKAVAEDLQKRAANGESFKTLQAEAWQKAGQKGAPPEVELKQRPGTLPEDSPVLKLKPGEVSPIIREEPAFFIYKLNGKGHMALSEAKAEITSNLQRQKFDQEKHAVMPEAPVLNQDFFGDTTVPRLTAPMKPK